MLVLSDGVDTSATEIEDVTATIKGADIKVDVISLGQTGAEAAPLETIAAAGRGTVLSTQDPEALSGGVRRRGPGAREVGAGHRRGARRTATEEATLAVTIDAAGETFTDSAFVSVLSADRRRLRPAPDRSPHLRPGSPSRPR